MRAGCVLAAAARCMHLRAMEGTFMPPKLVESVRVGLGHSSFPGNLAARPGISGSSAVGSGHAPAVPPQQVEAGSWEQGPSGAGCAQVWDLSEPEGVAGAASAQQQALVASYKTGALVPSAHSSWMDGSAHAEGSSSSSAASSLLLGLRCAANCSNSGRFTPLHMCCIRGDARSVRQLLLLGAVSVLRSCVCLALRCLVLLQQGWCVLVSRAQMRGNRTQ